MTPPNRKRCRGRTLKGTRCERRALDGSDYCHHHGLNRVKTGRPSTISKAKIDAIVQSIRNGAYQEQACIAAGIGVSTFYLWRERGEAHIETGEGSLFAYFVEEVTRAQAAAENDMIGVIRSAALGGKQAVQNPLTGEITEVDVPGDWRAAEAYLKRRHPARWGNRTNVDVTGSISGGEPRTVEPAHEDRDQLLKLIDGLTAQHPARGQAEPE